MYKLKQPVTFFDGHKAISAWNLDSMEGWTSLEGDDRTTVDPIYYYRVPWLHRAVKDRANNVGSMPFHILRGETEVDNSQDYQNALDFFKSPKLIFSLLEMSLAMDGRAYLFLETNRGGYIKSLKYLVASTITEIYNKDTDDKGVAELIIGKHRGGPKGTARVAFDGNFTLFRDLPNESRRDF
jgi:hypothetical protein